MGDSNDARFPRQSWSPAGLPPSPSAENPGQVFPQSDPKAASTLSIPGTGIDRRSPALEFMGNPFALEDAFNKLDHALSEVISNITGEERSFGPAPSEDALVRKLSGWRDELTQIRSGRPFVEGSPRNEETVEVEQAGGLFTD